MLFLKIIKINIIIKKEGDMGNPTTVFLYEKSTRLACKGLNRTKEQAALREWDSFKVLPLRLSLYDSPIHSPKAP